ncbi:MAG: 16S rRNA pseudouridine(516) synthase [Burkholderiales bacterium]|nr:16S rRNA pseudouridine(516) synthase [Burkholderiales bacterium]MDE2455771.1 16S rRNA pseudouridine(516) synthase [Burkholderiales bacterium]
MQLAHLLFTQGFGTRRVCAGLVEAGLVRIGGAVVDDPGLEVDADGFVFEVEGVLWPYQASALVMLNKPAGYECSQKPRHHPSVMSLLPPPLRQRGLQPVGRLDEDTTGLLLLTDDGKLIHRLTSPRHHVPKVYQVQARHPVSEEQLERLRAGVALEDEPRPVAALAAERRGENALELTLAEGKYHQVKRMIAAVGNRCEALHRSRIGALELGEDLAPGRWRWIGAEERPALG